MVDTYPRLEKSLPPSAVSKQPSFLSPLGSNKKFLFRETSQSGTLKLLGMNSFTDAAGYLPIVGEIEKTTPTAIRFVKVVRILK